MVGTLLCFFLHKARLNILFDDFSLIFTLVTLSEKELDIAIVKATNHVECPPKERHVRSEY
jgi:hypothetical protein